jgi:hypothetical protein
MQSTHRVTILSGLTITLLLAACGPGRGGTQTPSPSAQPSPTPIASPIATLDEAARVAIASDPRFAGVTKLDPNLIGASAWWEGGATENGFEIKITIGWGDCPAGCINRHVWTFNVAADGTLTLVDESGDPLPAGSLPA